jgi:mannose-1-phosphate guanylyltransferase
MYSFHKQHGKICTILGTRVPASETKHYGILVQEPESHEVLHYVEKPEGFVSDLASCGIYLFSRSIFASLEQYAQDIIKASKAAHTGEDEEAYLFVDQNVLPNGDVKIQLEQDILVPLSAKKELFVYQTSAWWLPIKHVG